VLPTGRNFGRKKLKWPDKNISGRKNPQPNFWQNFLKMAELFLKCVIDMKALIICRNRLFNTLMNSIFFCYYFSQKSVKSSLYARIMCAAEFFRQRPGFFVGFGRKHLPGVGNTEGHLSVWLNIFQ
jgi:hypothetical protein